MTPALLLSPAAAAALTATPTPTPTASTATPGFGPSPSSPSSGASAGLDAFLIVLALAAVTVVIFIAMNGSLRRMRTNLGGNVLPRREADQVPVRPVGGAPRGSADTGAGTTDESGVEDAEPE